MSQMRFGRRLPMPSTRQIRHELILMMNEEARLNELKAAPADAGTAPVAPAAVTPI